MKVSLRTLLLGVTLAGVVIAAMSQPSLFWMRVMFTLTLAFLAVVGTGALAVRGKPRTFWVGAFAFGMTYFVMLMDGRMIDFHQQASMLPRALVTQQLLDWLAGARGLDVRSGYGDFKLWGDSMFQPEVPSGSTTTAPMGGMPGAFGPSGSQQGMSPGMGMGSAMMPGPGAPPVTGGFSYATYNHFLITGHCCFVILSGLGGGLLSLWMFGREETAHASV